MHASPVSAAVVLLGVTLLAAACTPPPPRVVGPPLIVGKFAADQAAIRAMAGLYRVTVEATLPDAAPGDPPQVGTAVERVILVEDTPTRIDLQHLLVLEEQGIALKFWRQRWEYRAEAILSYEGGRTWGFDRTGTSGGGGGGETGGSEGGVGEGGGRWTRTVFDADDRPLYAATGTFTPVKPTPTASASAEPASAGGSSWQSDLTLKPADDPASAARPDARFWALHERVTVRRDGTWTRDLTGTGGTLSRAIAGPGEFATTATTVRYDPLPAPPGEPDAAEVYWQQTAALWAAVRAAWDGVLAKRTAFTVREEVDGQPLWKRVFALAEAARVDPEARDWRGEMDALLDRYVVFARTVAE